MHHACISPFLEEKTKVLGSQAYYAVDLVFICRLVTTHSPTRGEKGLGKATERQKSNKRDNELGVEKQATERL